MGEQVALKRAHFDLGCHDFAKLLCSVEVKDWLQDFSHMQLAFQELFVSHVAFDVDIKGLLVVAHDLLFIDL